MSARFSQFVRAGSHTSGSTSSSVSIDTSAHNHTLSLNSSILGISSWLHEAWSPLSERHERVATSTLSMGIAVLTREMMEMHIVQAPDIRGMIDCLPVADRPMGKFIGWRQKIGTWPLLKHEALTSKQFAV